MTLGGVRGPAPSEASPATARGHGVVFALLLLVAGGLAIASVAFPYWEWRGTWGDGSPGVGDWYFDQECRNYPGLPTGCEGYGQVENVLGARAGNFVAFADAMTVAGALALVGGGVLVAAGAVDLGTKGMGQALSLRTRRTSRLATVGSLGILAAVVAVAVGVEAWATGGGPNGCAPAFFAFCGSNAWFAGPGWFLLVAAGALGVVALALSRKARSAGGVREMLTRAPTGEAPGAPPHIPPAPPPAALW